MAACVSCSSVAAGLAGAHASRPISCVPTPPTQGGKYPGAPRCSWRSETTACSAGAQVPCSLHVMVGTRSGLQRRLFAGRAGGEGGMGPLAVARAQAARLPSGSPLGLGPAWRTLLLQGLCLWAPLAGVPSPLPSYNYGMTYPLGRMAARVRSTGHSPASSVPPPARPQRRLCGRRGGGACTPHTSNDVAESGRWRVAPRPTNAIPGHPAAAHPAAPVHSRSPAPYAAPSRR